MNSNVFRHSAALAAGNGERTHTGQRERAAAQRLLQAWLDNEGRIELLPAEATEYLLAWIVHQQRQTDGPMETYVRSLVEQTRKDWKRAQTVKKVFD